MSGSTRFLVGGEHLGNGCRMSLGRGSEHLLNCIRDSGKGDAAIEEGVNGNLVGGIEGDAVGSADAGGLEGQAQAGKAVEVRLLEFKMAEGGQIKGQRRGGAFGKGQRIEDGKTHVGDGDLGEDGAVDVFDERVHGRLGMDGDADLAGGDVEETASLDDFEAFVEHGSRIDGDAAAHDPGRMLEGLLRGDTGELIDGGFAEGTAGCGEPDGFNFRVCTYTQTLMDGVVFAVDGEDGDVALLGGSGEDFASGDHAFLVGESDGLAGEDGGVGGFESGDADDGGDNKISFWQCRAGDSAGGAVDDLNSGDASLGEAMGERGGQLFSGHRNQAWTPARSLVKGSVDILAGGQSGNGITVGKLLDDRKGRLSDGTCRTENC